MNILSSAADAFTNPDSVWYYVIGVVFLVLIFAALAVYIVVSNKHKKNNENATGENADASTENDNAESKTPTYEKASADTTEEPDEEKTDEVKEEKIDEVKVEENASDKDEAKSKAADSGAEPNNDTVENNIENDVTVRVEEPAPVEVKEESADDKKADEPKEAPTAPKKRAPRKATTTVVKIMEENPTAQKEKTTAKSEKTEQPVAAQNKTAKKSAKPFIDRLLATKSAHGVYNEIKNTVLSYPGMKAKLTKEDEQFVYVEKKMAAIELDGSSIVLYLALDPTAVPSQFTVEPTGDASLPVKMTVDEKEIDGARRLVVFAMNVSMLTRNDKRRYVDYIQKAQDAKQRAKKK